jgi:hypothetical protein
VIKEHISFGYEWILQSYLDSKSGLAGVAATGRATFPG